MNAAKKAWDRKDARQVIVLTEDALRRIETGSLKTSRKIRQKLLEYRSIGYEGLPRDDRN